MPTPYGNRIDPVTDLFKQYKVRIWMSTVGLSFGCESSHAHSEQAVEQKWSNECSMFDLRCVSPAIGSAAIIKPSSGNSSLPVRPGFGAGYQNIPSLRSWFTQLSEEW